MWTINQDNAERSQIKRYSKKHPREVVACFANLERLCLALDGGLTIQEAETGLGFFSSEGGGIYRIAQTGVAHAKETRLYVLVIIVGSSIHVLTIGDKDTQQRDLRRSREIAESIKRNWEAGK